MLSRTAELPTEPCPISTKNDKLSFSNQIRILWHNSHLELCPIEHSKYFPNMTQEISSLSEIHGPIQRIDLVPGNCGQDDENSRIPDSWWVFAINFEIHFVHTGLINIFLPFSGKEKRSTRSKFSESILYYLSKSEPDDFDQ